MPTDRPMLVIGHSHVACIQSALEEDNSDQLTQVINLRAITETGMSINDVVEKLRALYAERAPHAVCLSIGGNFHNILGVIEDYAT